MNDEEVRILSQYVNALENASSELEKMYLQKNLEGMNKVKAFIREIHDRILQLLK